MPEIYISVDIESDGPIPGPHSMLSLGAAAFEISKKDGVKDLGLFTANFKELEGATQHPKTMKWWAKHPVAWELCRKDPLPPEIAMKQFTDWISLLPGRPVFVAWPAGYDFTFVYWYLMRFLGRSPFAWSALDAKSYAMAVKKKFFTNIHKGNVKS